MKTILGLALEFYNIKQTLRTGGTSAAIKARCEAEINRVEKQFDDCVAFLLRVCLLDTFLFLFFAITSNLYKPFVDWLKT